jgi:hypothetical protein
VALLQGSRPLTFGSPDLGGRSSTRSAISTTVELGRLYEALMRARFRSAFLVSPTARSECGIARTKLARHTALLRPLIGVHRRSKLAMA